MHLLIFFFSKGCPHLFCAQALAEYLVALYRPLGLSTTIGKPQCFDDGGDDYDDDDENDDDDADYFNNDQPFHVCPSCGADSAVMN